MKDVEMSLSAKEPATISAIGFAAVSSAGRWYTSMTITEKRDTARTARKLSDGGIQDFSEAELKIISEAIAESYSPATLWAFDTLVAEATKAENQ